jgi:hypothetical protein
MYLYQGKYFKNLDALWNAVIGAAPKLNCYGEDMNTASGRRNTELMHPRKDYVDGRYIEGGQYF